LIEVPWDLVLALPDKKWCEVVIFSLLYVGFQEMVYALKLIRFCLDLRELKVLIILVTLKLNGIPRS